MYRASATLVLPCAMTELGQRHPEHDEQQRGRHHDDRRQPDPGGEVVPDQRVAAFRRVRAHPGEQRGDHRDPDDGVRQLEQLPGVAVGGERVVGRPGPGGGRVGHVLHDEEGGLGGQHVAEQRGGHPADLGDLGPPEVEPGPPPEADPAQERDQGRGLHDDAQRGTEAEQFDLATGDRGRRGADAPGRDEQQQDADHDDVVEDGGPHGRGEASSRAFRIPPASELTP